MPRRRRARPPHPARGRFDPVLRRVEAAKELLLEAMPSPRGVPRRALAEALVGFERELAEASGSMVAWREPGTEMVWTRCERALREALDGAERLRLEAPPLDYESLVLVLSDLMAPLEAFESADHALS